MWQRTKGAGFFRKPAPTGFARRAAGPASAGAPQSALVAAGLFDAEFYGALVARAFERPEHALAHFLRHGMQSGSTCHPLVDIAMLPREQQERWRAGDDAAVVDHLLSPHGLMKPWSHLFDPRRLSLRRGRDALAWLAGLRPTTVLPTPRDLPRAVTWESARHAMLVRAAEIGRRSKERRSRRLADHWDETAEAQWLSRLAESPLPGGQAPLVSVVMPVWNRADRIADAIASLQAQTFTAWELLVVDDGSTDGTAGVLSSLAAADERIVVMTQPHMGVSAARNAALAQVRAPYVAFLDSDNVWRPHYLDTMLRAMARDGLAAAYAGLMLQDAEAVRYRVFDGGLDALLARNHIDMNVLMLETTLARGVGGFDESLRRWVDHDFVVRVARRAVPRFLPFIGCDYDDRRDDRGPRISTTESDHWKYVVLGKTWVDWESARTKPRSPGRTSVIVRADGDVPAVVHTVTAVLGSTVGRDVEIVVVDDASLRDVALALQAALIGVDRVSVVRRQATLSHAIAANIGAVESAGDCLLFLRPGTTLRDGWLDEMRGKLRDPDIAVVQPRPGPQAYPQPQFCADAGAVMVGAETFLTLNGFDPIFVDGSEVADLCRRAHQLTGGACGLAGTVGRVERRVDGDPVQRLESERLFLDRWRARCCPVAVTG